MATFYVRKDGSGTHTTIQSAFIQAVSGDTIDVGSGLFEENVDFCKSGITLKGAGKNQTEIRGVVESNVSKACTFSSGSTTLNIAAGTSGWLVGRYIQGTGLAAGTRIVSISDTSVTVSLPTTMAKTNQSVLMVAVPASIVVRGANHKVKDLKITAVQASELRCLSDNAAIFFRTAGYGELAASGYILEDCIIEARGESAIMTDAASGVGNGIIRNNVIQGKTFVGASAAQVPAFGTMTKSGTVLSARTIQFSDLSGITAPNAVNTQGSEITPGLRVASISGNVVTVTANIPDAVGTSRSFSFANVQFNYPNVARQLVVVQGVNQPTQFINNTVNGVTGSGISYNTAVTVDTASAVITGNTINGEFKYGYALRARGANSSVSNNVNFSLPGNENAGYLIGPTGSQTSGYNIGTNTTVVTPLVQQAQVVGSSSVTVEMNKDLVKQNSKVVSNPSFSNEADWKHVSFVYKHDSSSRRLVSTFKSLSSPKKTKLKVNMKSGDNFQLHKIIICKLDNSFLVIKRDEISSASSFDFVLLNDGPSSGGSGGGVNSNAITWFSGNIDKYTLGSNGSLTKVIDGMDGSAITNETAFSGPFEITYSFNGYLSNYGFIGFSSNSGNSSKDGFGYFVAFNGSSQPRLGTSSSPNFQFPSYGIDDLSSGLNTITFKMNSSGAVSIVVNGVETALGSVSVANQYYAAVRLATSGEVITSSTKV